MYKHAVLAALAALMSATAIPALAAGGHGKMPEIGEPGDASAVTRTIEVVMYDNYYEPEEITVKEGETVRFIVKNAGDFVHEFSIATAAMVAEHAPEMEMMVEHGILEPDRINHDLAKKMQDSMGHGMHDAANTVLLEPGDSDEIVWTFPAHVELEFACSIPGHYESGMVGEFSLTH